MVQKKENTVKKNLMLRIPESAQKKLALIAAIEVLENGGKRMSATKLAEELVVRFAESRFETLKEKGILREDMLNG